MSINPMTDRTTEEALIDAWQSTKAACDPSGWTVSDSAAYRGFFAHGFRAALQWQAEQHQFADADKMVAASTHGVPPGYALVPVEPTSNMLAAMSGEWHSSRHAHARKQYADMLSSLPQAPQGEQG